VPPGSTADDRSVEAEPVVYREEVTAMLFTIADINVNVGKIVRLLEEDTDGEEEGPQEDDS
jgi:hypothetical protein